MLGRIGSRHAREGAYSTGEGLPDAGLIHLATLRHLRDLSLDYTAVTAAGVAELERSHPRLRVRHGASVDQVAEVLGRYFGDWRAHQLM